MAQHEIIHLPFGRLATIERQRTARGKCERVAFLDTLPLRVSRATDLSAPVALVAQAAGDRFADNWRAYEGRLYRPLWGSRQGIGCTPEEATRELRARAEREAKGANGHWFHNNGELVYNNGPLRKAAPSERGIGPEGHHPVRRTVDDGRESQSVAVAEVAERLLLVGGRLYHVAPVPGWQITEALVNGSDRTTQLDTPRMRFSNTAWRPYHKPRETHEIYAPDAHPWLTFGPEQGNEAGAVAEALVAALGRQVPDALRPTLVYRQQGDAYVVTDRAAFLSTQPPAGPDAWLTRIGEAFLSAAAGTLGRMPTSAVEAYLDARRAVEGLAAGGGHEAAFPAVRAMADLVKDHQPFDGRYPDRALIAAHVVPLRYDLFERHRIPQAADEADLDMRSLSTLAHP